MKYRLLQWLACPKCQASQFVVECLQSIKSPIYQSHFTKQQQHLDGVNLASLEEEEVIEGFLHCGKCSQVYPIQKGIPRMVLNSEIAKTTSGHKFTRFQNLQDISVWECNFQEVQKPLQPNDFLGKTVVDVGCGYGRHAYFAARYGAEVLAIDIHADAVEMTQENTKDFQHVHVIQADAAQLPLKEESMDRLYCFGVLHHVENATDILSSMHKMLKSGGSLSLWVYGPRQGLTLMINNALRGMTTNMEHEDLLKVSRGIARMVRLGSHTPYKIFQKVPLAHSIVSHLPLHDHHKWPWDVVVADIYDRLRVPVLQWFTQEQLENWYIANGYVDCHVNRIIRNNETFSATGIKR